MHRSVFLFCFILIVLQVISSHTGRLEAQDKTAYCLNLARIHCPDAWYLLKEDRQEKFKGYIQGKGPDDWAKSLPLAVHETCHLLAYHWQEKTLSWSFSFYISPNQRIECTQVPCFNSNELNDFVPDSLRKKLDRYEEYIGKKSRLSSQVNGINGLLDEFCAYYHDCLADYQLKRDGLISVGSESTSVKGKQRQSVTYRSYTNKLEAFYEFRLYISWYLQYARKEHSDTYKSLYRETCLRTAFTRIDDLFAELAAQIATNEKLKDHYTVNTMKFFTSKDLEELSRFRIDDKKK